MNAPSSLSRRRAVLRTAVSLVIASLIGTGMYARVEHLKAVEARYQTIEAERKAELAEVRANVAEERLRELQAQSPKPQGIRIYYRHYQVENLGGGKVRWVFTPDPVTQQALTR